MKTSRPTSAHLLLLAATLTFAGGSLAAQWKTVRVTPEKTAFLDVSGIARNGEAARAWELERFSADQENKAWEGKYRAVKSHIAYDCARRTTEPLLRVYLGADGAEMKRVQMEGLQFPSAVEPDSLREKMLELACGKNDAEKAAAKPSEKSRSGLMPEAAAAEVSKGAPKEGAPKETGEPAKKAAEAAPDKGKPAENAKTDEKAAEKTPPTKIAMLSKVEAPQEAAPVTAAPTVTVRRAPRPETSSRVAMRRVQRAKPAPNATAAKQAEAHWAYAGEAGADNWGAIRPEFAACAEGRQQSPIDIRDGARLELEPIEFSYAPGPLRIVDNGHTVQVNVEAGRYIVVTGRRYDLKQFHFHKPAEERIDGRSYDMVAHLVHKDVDGRIAVIAVLFEGGGENAFIRKLWPFLPLERGIETYLPEVRLELDKLLPESRAYYTYMGSLTTPPCSEGVLWIVMKTPVAISAEQVAVFSRLYPMNARPVQATNGRFIKESM